MNPVQRGNRSTHGSGDDLAWLPVSVLRDRALSPGARLAYAALVNLAASSKSAALACGPTKLARLVGGIDRRTARTHIRELVRRGLVRCVAVETRQRVALELLPPANVYSGTLLTPVTV